MENPRFALCLEQIKDDGPGLVGAKALNLARMGRIGLPVPPGFCVAGAAYREHVQSGDVMPRINAATARLRSASREDRHNILSAIRQAIVECPLSEKLTDQIGRHYGRLGQGAVAVRSSATAEDLPKQSFAGQYDTYLGVSSLSKCLESVKHCWASLWTERAFEYREKNGVDHLGIDMAVIVQKLVPADASGVLFTADPLSGRKDRITVEGSFGLGDAVVRCKAMPDRFVLSKKHLRPIERLISNKTCEIVPDVDGGLRQRAIPQQRGREPCLGLATLKRLAKLALKVESLFGSPQDIEWAVSRGDIFLLQSRPITALPQPQAKSWQERQVWTDANLGEVAPDVVTPFTLSIYEFFRNTVVYPLLRRIGVELGENPLAGLVAGRIYFNVNTIAGVLRHLPRPFTRGINNAFGGQQAKMFELGELQLRDDDIPDVRVNRGRAILMAPVFLLLLLSHTPRRARRFIARIDKKTRRLQSLNLPSMSNQEIAEHLVSEAEDLRDLMPSFLYLPRAMIALPILDKACRKWFGDKNGSLANSLMAATGELHSAQAGRDLWRLAAKAHEVSTVEKVILGGYDWQATRERLARARCGDEFLRWWDVFMERHGHRTPGELELHNPRWSERPDHVLGFVRNYIGFVGGGDPLEDFRKRARQRQMLTERCRRRLRSPLKRAIFDYLVVQAQQGAAFRENVKSGAMRYWGLLRKVILQLGERFHREGLLGTPDDIFFLTVEEVGLAVRGELEFGTRDIVAHRRDEHEKNKSVRPPHVVIGVFDPENPAPDAVDADTDALTGIAVSPGQATGKARVILRADAKEHVLPGEILVAPFTDPGWTPYFVPAAGIVMDQGGLLSHGSILAREYGIPAVVNVGPATKIIRPGQTVQVDGDRGLVRIIDKPNR